MSRRCPRRSRRRSSSAPCDPFSGRACADRRTPPSDLTTVKAPLAVEAQGLERIYASGTAPVAALAGVSVAVRKGEFVAVDGASGAGKTTLLHAISRLERPTPGTDRVHGQGLSTPRQPALPPAPPHQAGKGFSNLQP